MKQWWKQFWCRHYHTTASIKLSKGTWIVKTVGGDWSKLVFVTDTCSTCGKVLYTTHLDEKMIREELDPADSVA